MKKGYKFSDEQRKRLSEAHIGIQAGSKHPLFGKHHSEEAKRKIRRARKKQIFSLETRDKFRQRMIGNKYNVGRGMHPNTRKALLKAIAGKNNVNWKGDAVGYHALHSWVKRKKGSPSACESVGCKGKSKTYHWANKSGKYKRVLSDWVRLCVSCHKLFDSKKKK